MSRVTTFFRQPLKRQRFALEAAWDLAAARLSVRRRGQYGALDAIGDRTDETGEFDAAELRPLLRDVSWSIEATAKTMPWNTLCLTQAIATARMLRARGIPWQIHVGLARDDAKELIAHAWLTCGDRVVVGGSEVGRYARLVSYGSR